MVAMLEVIHLHSVFLTDASLRRMVAVCPCLRNLDLRYCCRLAASTSLMSGCAASRASPSSTTSTPPSCGSWPYLMVVDSTHGTFINEIALSLDTIMSYFKRTQSSLATVGYLQIDVGSMDEHSTKSDEEYEGLAMHDVMATGPMMSSKM
ncbi:hypothetical protein ZEAMMB73_Zm00001d052614 [Zea mays]|uniref:F-box protein n=1 Tax=Zea mays TaxID=4577 RepID=A0A1D6QHZ6_MAIZE|nr:hypothetical protein ZEAMMB73_Zm00001d052614 [Zea mays]